MPEVKAKRTIADIVWGRMGQFALSRRIAALLFVAASIAAMTFCQLGFWPIGVIDGKAVYLMLLLGPLVMGAIMFGPAMGTFLGLFTGVVAYIHAMVLPLDYYEVYYMMSLGVVVVLTAFGALAGALFSLILRHWPHGAMHSCIIVVACIILSFIASGLMIANVVVSYGVDYIDILKDYIFTSPLGFVVQAVVDAVLMAVLCLIGDSRVRALGKHGDERTLLSIFRNWMLMVSAIVFMLSSAIIFSVATFQAQEKAEQDMKGEIDYLTVHLASLDRNEYGSLLLGYDVASDGYVVILDENGTILASDDEGRYPKGGSFIELLGYADTAYGDEEKQDLVAAMLERLVDEDGMAILQAAGEEGVQSLDFTFVYVASFSDGYVAVQYTTDMIYKARFDTMFASTSLALLLIVAIAVLATILLNQIVVRRVDETNVTLGKITAGDLGERVNIRDSREFISLSTGINSTVAALKHTIDEVKQRNAQELMTAKAIQESALPTDFPAFPDIDRFDIYASMKTAKEVGGDFYDFFEIDGANKIGFVMADVSGKGIPAALFMMTAKTQLRNYISAGLPVNEAVDAANHQLCIGNDAGMFVTAWVGVLDYETGELAYVNAGHNPPLMLREGSWNWMRDVSGMPLGLFDGIPYDAYEIKLEEGEMLYLYTDGVTEAMDTEGELFGEERLHGILRQYAAYNPRSTCVGVRRALTDFTHDAEQSDDITMLGLKYGVPPETSAVMVLPAKDDQLIHVCNYIHAELHRRHAPKSVYNQIDIAAEELFVNVCHYAYPDATPENPGEVRIGFEYSDNPPSLTVQIADDGIPYNPMEKPDAVTPDDIADVPIGGLGILMAKQSVDEMTYERLDGSNVVTIVKKW